MIIIKSIMKVRRIMQATTMFWKVINKVVEAKKWTSTSILNFYFLCFFRFYLLQLPNPRAPRLHQVSVRWKECPQTRPWNRYFLCHHQTTKSQITHTSQSGNNLIPQQTIWAVTTLMHSIQRTQFHLSPKFKPRPALPMQPFCGQNWLKTTPMAKVKGVTGDEFQVRRVRHILISLAQLHLEIF